ncbi:aspartate/glutamate racemase family protein [Nonomuraea sp. CA-143628]|uniref:aspartate/glutamate racemase family protein n=1 Tax=Nonomuraea sp. CA-143628 TaxID=3239997 RepID=UPI003D8B82A0
MRLLVVNCNTSSEVTATIVTNARAAAGPGTEIIGIQPAWGPESAEGYFESFVSAAAVLDAVATYPEPFDAVVMAGFGEHGREGARQLITQPVVDITEAAAQVASLVSHRFGVVTTMATAIPGIEESLRNSGLGERCTAVVATDVPVVSIHDSGDELVETLSRAAETLLDRGADAIVLGCAGFAGLDQLLEQRLGVPVIDPVASAVVIAQSLVSLGKKTSKKGAFAPPNDAKRWVGWPVSQRTALTSNADRR